jgi:CheY-like chemotaxis protein
MPEEKKMDPQVLKERLGKHLRTADEYTRSGKYEEAILEIHQALDLDPKNNYARSFLERVKLMHKRSQQKETEQAVSVEISFEERMSLISEYLANAEAFINQKDYQHALEEVAKVYKIDSKNYYAQTYSERIETLMLEQEAELNAKREAEEVAKIKAEEKAKKEAEEKAKKEAEEKAKKDAEEKIRKEAEEAKEHARREAEERSRIQEEVAKKQESEQIVIDLPAEGNVEQPQLQERGSILMYRELLKDFWFDGKMTEEESAELASMRDLFGITKDEHLHLERETKIESYVEALRIAWRDNVLSDTEQKALQMMREKYNISEEEQKIAESRYEEIKRTAKTRNVVMIVDPDRDMLVSLNKLLKQRGFVIFMAQKAEDALQILNTQTPDCIISEVLFPKGQMDGVIFFKKVREHQSLKTVPFLFLSSIKDKNVISASYRLGIDHFLSKPVDTDSLLALIEGKTHTAN